MWIEVTLINFGDPRLPFPFGPGTSSFVELGQLGTAQITLDRPAMILPRKK